MSCAPKGPSLMSRASLKGGICEKGIVGPLFRDMFELDTCLFFCMRVYIGERPLGSL